MIQIVSLSEKNYLPVFQVFLFPEIGLYSFQKMFSTQNKIREQEIERRNPLILRTIRKWIANWKHFGEKMVDLLRVSRSSRLTKKTHKKNKMIKVSAAGVASFICITIIASQTVFTYSLFSSKASTSMTVSAAPVFCTNVYNSTVTSSVYDSTYGTEHIKSCSSLDNSTITMNVYGSSENTYSPMATSSTEAKAVTESVYGIKEE